MVAIKAHQANAFLKKIDPKLRAVLFFGPDVGMVSERGRQVAEHFCAREAEPGELIRLDDNDMTEEPERFAIELQTIPMFGGQKVVRAPVTAKLTPSLVEQVFEDGMPQSALVLEAGDLKPTHKIRKLFEAAPFAAAVACYPDTARDLSGVVDEVLGGAELSIDREAKGHLVSLLGADRALSRNEVEKLALYARGRGTVSIADIDAVIGNASELALDHVALAAASGNIAVAAQEFDRLVASGQAVQSVLLAIQRHMLRLHRVKAAYDGGKSMDVALRGARPPVHFKVKDQFSAQVSGWAMPRLNEAMRRTQDAVQRSREMPLLERDLAERLLLEITSLSGRKFR